MHSTRVVAAIAIAVALSSPARGQEKPEKSVEEQGRRTVALARFLEPLRAQDWAAAEAGFQALARDFPDLAQRPSLLLKLAEAQLAQPGSARRADALATLERTIERDPSSIQARLLLARTLARGRDPRALEAAKEQLLTAAGHGLFVLREVFARSDDALEPLRRDPEFLLRALRASQPAVSPLTTVRCPFQSPWRRLVPDEPPPPPPPVKQETHGEAAARRIDEAEANARLARAVEEGLRFLRILEQAVSEERLDDAVEAWKALEAVAKRLRQEPAPEHARAADALLLRGTPFRETAERLRRARAFVLDVTGIVIDRRADSTDRAIVNGRIYAVGEPIVDREDREIQGLRLVKLREGLARFRFENVEFSRTMRTP